MLSLCSAIDQEQCGKVWQWQECHGGTEVPALRDGHQLCCAAFTLEGVLGSDPPMWIGSEATEILGLVPVSKELMVQLGRLDMHT